MKLKGIKATVYGTYAGYCFTYKGIDFIAYRGSGEWYLKCPDLDTDGEVFKTLKAAKERGVDLVERLARGNEKKL